MYFVKLTNHVQYIKPLTCSIVTYTKPHRFPPQGRLGPYRFVISRRRHAHGGKTKPGYGHQDS